MKTLILLILFDTVEIFLIIFNFINLAKGF
jgi:hypothetical protein